MMEYVEWSEPVPGIDAEGKETTGTRICRMTEEDATNFERAAVLREREDLTLADLDAQELLKDFIVTNWAQIKEYPE